MLAEARRAVDRGDSDQKVCAMLEANWGFHIKPKKFNKSFVQPYKDWKESVAAKRQYIEARVQAMGEGGMNAAALSKLWDMIDEMPASELIKVARVMQEYQRINVEFGKLEVAKKQAETESAHLQLKLQELENQRAAERKQVEEIIGGAESDEKPAGKVLERIRDLFGLSNDAPSRAGAALPGSMDPGRSPAEDSGVGAANG